MYKVAPLLWLVFALFQSFPATAQCLQEVSAGIYHSIGLKSDGTLWAWGFNGDGQLGDATYNEKKLPVQVGAGTQWKAISAGGNHTLAIASDGTLWAWGNNLFGQLGTNDFHANKNVPTKIGTDTNWSSVYAGRSFSLAIKTDGTLWAWGDNYYGQLGTSTTVALVPTKVSVNTNWKSISAGGNHTLAITTDGALWAWGSNLDGQLGDGTGAHKSIPTRIGTGTNWKSISAGYDFSVAIKTDGTLWTTGNNDNGQLGTGDFNAVNTFTQTGSDNSWNVAAAGNRSTHAVKTNGSLWSWGWAVAGLNTDNRKTPTRTGTLNTWSTVVSGDDHVFAFQADYSLWAWGIGTWGKIGDDSWADYADPQIISPRVPTVDPAQTLCTAATIGDVMVSGAAVRWYDTPTSTSPLPSTTVLVNGVHYFASGTKYNCESITRLDFTPNLLTPPPKPTGFSSQSFCSDATLEDIVVSGENISYYDSPLKQGPLGYWNPLVNGNKYYITQTSTGCESEALEVLVAVGSPSAPSGSANQTVCAGSRVSSLVAVGSNITWYPSPFSWDPALPNHSPLDPGGDYYATQTVNGCESATRLKVIPTFSENNALPPSSPTPIVADKLYNGDLVSAVIDVDGRLWIWGLNSDSQFPDGTLNNRKSPSLLSDERWSTIAIGGDHILAIKRDGTLWTWGRNYYGQMGIGAAPNDGSTIIQIGTDNDWQSIAAGTYFSAAIKTNGTLWTWGMENMVGDGAGTQMNTLVPKQLGTRNYEAVYAGNSSLFAVSNTDVYAWGYNSYGDVGVGSNTTQYVPRYIGVTGWKMVSGSDRHSAGIRLDGTLWTWGSNSNGGLGVAGRTDTNIPLQAGSATDWTTVATSITHNLALKTDGTLWAWGKNNNYQLGDGTATDRFEPTQIGTDTDWKSVGAAGGFSTAIKNDGTVWHWGSILTSETGGGMSTIVKTPKQIHAAAAIVCTSSTLADLTVNGSNIQWYSRLDYFDPLEPSTLSTSTVLANRGNYLATQTVNGCESQTPLEVSVLLGVSNIQAPTGTPSQSFCNGSTVSNLKATGSNIKWYPTPAGGSALPASAVLTNNTHYYASQSTGACESSSRFGVLVLIDGTSTAAPTGAAAQNFCDGATVVNLVAVGTEIKWYPLASGGSPLPIGTVLENGKHYYASRSSNGCESVSRLDVTAIVRTTAAPTGNAVQSFCTPSTVADLTASGTAIEWHDLPAAGTTLTPSTPLANGSHVYASQTVNGCSSKERLDVAIILKDTSPPVGEPAQSFCAGASVASLVAIGSQVQWFSTPSNGTPLSSASVLVHNAHYYASQVVDGCTSPARLDVIATIETVNAPTGDALQTFCENAAITDLKASGTSIKWYKAATGGSSLVLTELITNNEQYFASQTIGTCESPQRLTVTAKVNTIPPAPTGANEQVFENGYLLTDIFVSGTGIRWYEELSDIGNNTEVLQSSTQLIADKTYYATQTISGCESTAALPVKIIIITGIEDQAMIGYHPNPVKNVLTIRCDGIVDRVTVTNSIQQVLMNRKLHDSEVILDLSSLNSGLYLIHVQQGSKSRTIKVIKE